MQQFNIINFIVFLFLSVLAYTAENIKLEKIIGGNEASQYQFKYQVSVQVNHKHKCGGGVIGNLHILTAAHCFIDAPTGKLVNKHFTVVAPAVNKVTSIHLTKIYEIEKIYIPRNYRSINLNSNEQYIFVTQGDIAVIKLQEDLNLVINKQVEKLLLSRRNQSHYGDIAILVGQGYNVVSVEKDSETNQHIEIGSSDGKLRFVYTKIVSNIFCNTDGFYYFTHYYICSKTIQRDSRVPEGTCVGDSGGPLVINGNTITGILIYGPVGCHENQTGAIYIKVSAHMSFIESAIADEKAADIRAFTLTKKKCLCTKYKFVEN